MKSFFAVLFFVSISFSQQLRIKVDNSQIEHAALLSLSGEKTEFIDSLKINQSGEFNYDLGKIKVVGFFRLQLDNYKFLDFLNDGKDISLETDADDILDSMKVISSESNKLFYEFVRLNKDYKTKSELLQFVLAKFPKDDNYYEISKKRMADLQLEYLKFINETSQTDPKSFIARYIRSAQLPVINFSLQPEEQLAYLQNHSLDNVDFSDNKLIYSDVFTNKTIEFLTYYRNPQLPKELLEKEFIKASDKILDKAKVNQLVYQQIVDYLIDGFKKFGFDLVLDHIIENYVVKDDLCLDEETENSIEKRVDQAQKLSVGTEAPSIILPDSTGKEINLSDIKAERIVVLFYSSECPHCRDLIPKLKKVYESQDKKEFEVFAVSLDSDVDEWKKFIQETGADWINVIAPGGWDSIAASRYFIYATPTIFVIDKDKRIILKPLTVEEIVKML